jgi:hypothetical protein
MGKGLSGKKTKAITALLFHKTLNDAAASVNISDVTLWRWLQEADFKEAYSEARSQLVRQAIGHIQKASSEAVQVLREVMLGRESPSSSRVAAAKAVLDTALKAVEVESLEVRISVLETQLGKMGSVQFIHKGVTR